MEYKVVVARVSKDNCVRIKPEVVRIDNLNNIYGILDCDCIDIITRRIGNDIYSIVIDDEGALKPNNIITMINVVGNSEFDDEVIYGNFIVCKHDTDGEMRSLSGDDFFNIFQNLYCIDESRMLLIGSCH